MRWRASLTEMSHSNQDQNGLDHYSFSNTIITVSVNTNTPASACLADSTPSKQSHVYHMGVKGGWHSPVKGIGGWQVIPQLRQHLRRLGPQLPHGYLRPQVSKLRSVSVFLQLEASSCTAEVACLPCQGLVAQGIERVLGCCAAAHCHTVAVGSRRRTFCMWARVELLCSE